MTAVWPLSWERVSYGGREYFLERFGDGWHVIVELSTVAITDTRQAAIVAIAAHDDKIKGGGGDGDK